METVDVFAAACDARQKAEHVYNELAEVTSIMTMQTVTPRELHEACHRALRLSRHIVAALESATTHTVATMIEPG